MGPQSNRFSSTPADSRLFIAVRQEEEEKEKEEEEEIEKEERGGGVRLWRLRPDTLC